MVCNGEKFGNIVVCSNLKIENMFNELIDLVKEIFRKNIESDNWFFLVMYDEEEIERDEFLRDC